MKRLAVFCDLCHREMGEGITNGGWRLSKWWWKAQLYDLIPKLMRRDVCGRCAEKIIRAPALSALDGEGR